MTPRRAARGRDPRRPGTGRVVGAVLAVGLTAGLSWFVGVEPGRAVALCAAVAVLVLLARLEDSGEDAWPQPAAPLTSPGRQEAVLTLRQLEGARRDPSDRAVVAERLARLAATGQATDPDLDRDVRAAVGLPTPRASRSRGPTRTSAPPSRPSSRPSPPATEDRTP